MKKWPPCEHVKVFICNFAAKDLRMDFSLYNMRLRQRVDRSPVSEKSLGVRTLVTTVATGTTLRG